MARRGRPSGRARARLGGDRPQPVYHRLHLGDHRAAQGRGAHPLEHRLGVRGDAEVPHCRCRLGRAALFPCRSRTSSPRSSSGPRSAKARASPRRRRRTTSARCVRAFHVRGRACSKSISASSGNRNAAPPAKQHIFDWALFNRQAGAKQRHQAEPTASRPDWFLRKSNAGRSASCVSGGAPCPARNRRVLPRRRRARPRGWGCRDHRGHLRQPSPSVELGASARHCRRRAPGSPRTAEVPRCAPS